MNTRKVKINFRELTNVKIRLPRSRSCHVQPSGDFFDVKRVIARRGKDVSFT